MSVGKPYVWKTSNDDIKWVLNFPTKPHWSKKSQLEWVKDGLKHLRKNYKRWGIISLALPALGCSLGGLNWTQVKPLMEKHLSKLDIPVEIYEPLPSSKEHNTVRKKQPRKTTTKPKVKKQGALF